MEEMRYLKLFENFQDIDSLCKEYVIGNYTIRSDGSVDVDGDVWLRDIGFAELPIRFGKVTGEFDCPDNGLETLEGCPKEVGGWFQCKSNKLTSLEGCPKEVGGYFDCSWNSLSSLKWFPKEIGGDFYCYRNGLTLLDGCPERIVGGFYCYYNKLTSLVGSPKEVGGNLLCCNNKLKSLEGCPKEVGGDFICYYNQLTIIDYLPEWIEGDIDFRFNQIRDIKVEDRNWRFFGKCNLDGSPINDLFQYWEGDLKNFILDLYLEDFIRDDGNSVDILRFEYALNGKEYKEEDITNYKLIWKE